MKKICFVLIACLFTLLTSAQENTAKNLQGNWKLTNLIVGGVNLDVASGKITVAKETEIITAPDALAQIKNNMEKHGEALKNSSIQITGSNIKQIMAGKAKKGSFTLKENNKAQAISAKFDDGTTSEIPVKIINGQLHVTNHSNKQEFVYTRE